VCPWLVGGPPYPFLCFFLHFSLFFFLSGNVERDLTWMLKFVLGLAGGGTEVLSASTGQN